MRGQGSQIEDEYSREEAFERSHSPSHYEDWDRLEEEPKSLYGIPDPSPPRGKLSMDAVYRTRDHETAENMSHLFKAQEEATAMHANAVNDLMGVMRKTMLRQIEIMRGVMALESFLRRLSP